MTTNPTTPPNDDDMPAEIDFSGGTRGKFYRPNNKHYLPVDAAGANIATEQQTQTSS